MKRINVLLVFTTILLILFASYSSYFYYTANDVCKVTRIRRSDETKNANTDTYSTIIKNTHEIINTEDFEDNTVNEILFIISNKVLTLFAFVTVIMSLLQFYLYIRNWIIQISQSNQKIFLVHYSQIKDGKKNALSLSYSI